MASKQAKPTVRLLKEFVILSKISAYCKPKVARKPVLRLCLGCPAKFMSTGKRRCAKCSSEDDRSSPRGTCRVIGTSIPDSDASDH